MNDRWQGWHRLLLAFILLAGLAAYGGNLNSYFLKDDLSISMLTGGTNHFDPHTWYRQLIWPVDRQRDDIFRPATALTWAPDYLLFGPDPFGFHLWNLFLHLLNGVLLYALLNRLTRFRTPLVGFFGGLFFVVHPLHPEAVLWMTQRFVVMGLTMSLLCLLFYHVYLHQRRRWQFLAVWVVLLLACYSKELGATLPASLLFMALAFGPKRSWKKIAKDFLVAGLCSALVLALYFGTRYLVFQRFLGAGYAGSPSMAAYARQSGTFEKYPQSLLACLVPANTFFVRGLGRLAFEGLVALVSLLALWRLVRLFKSSPETRRLAGLALIFSGTAFLPTWYIFIIGANLSGGRFGYHLLALPLGLLAAALVLPLPGRSKGWLHKAQVFVCGLLAASLALVLQLNLKAYSRGGEQVRGIQEALVKEQHQAPKKSLLVVFKVPFDEAGCPTIDRYLPQLLKHPLVRHEGRAYPFVATQESRWYRQLEAGPASLPAALGKGRSLRFFVAQAWPPSLRALFGAQEPQRGERPVQLLSPKDGSILPCPLPGPDGEPLFRFQTQAGDQRFVLHFLWGESAIEGASKPLVRHLSLLLQCGKNASKEKSLVTYRLSAGDQRKPGERSLWELLQVQGAYAPPLPILWRVESQTASGKPVGLSKTFRLVLIPGPERKR